MRVSHVDNSFNKAVIYMRNFLYATLFQQRVYFQFRMECYKKWSHWTKQTNIV